MESKKVTVNGVEVELIGDWYIKSSAWYGSDSLTASVCAGEWRKNKWTGKIVLGGCKKRKSFYNDDEESRNKAIVELRAFIEKKSSSEGTA